MDAGFSLPCMVVSWGKSGGASMAGIYQFENIYHGLSAEVGSESIIQISIRHHSTWTTIELRVAPSGVAWKGVSSEEVTYVQATDLKWALWLRVARGFQLRLGLRDHKKHKFDGFIREVTTHTRSDFEWNAHV
jgi:hypothetical protein